MIPLDRVLVVLIFVIILPVIFAGEDHNPSHIAKVDEFYKERADKAVIEAMRSYQPNPEEVTKTFTEQVDKWVILSFYIQLLINLHMIYMDLW